MILYIGLAIVLCLLAAFNFRYHRLVMVSASALFPILAARLATVLSGAEEGWFVVAPWPTAGATAAVLALIGLRRLNHYPPAPEHAADHPDRPTGMDRILARIIAAAYGLLAGLALFAWAAWQLQGQPDGYLWHAGFAAGGAVALGFAIRFRKRAIAAIGASAGLTTLALAIWGALVFPGFVQKRAEFLVARADARAYCFVAPLRATEPPDYVSPMDRTFDFASWPREPQDLTLLTVAKPLGMVIQNDFPVAHEDFDSNDTFVWDLFVWPALQLDFSFQETGLIREHRPAIFADCVPRVGFPPGANDRDLREGIIFSRSLLAESGIEQTWGPVLRDVFAIPAVLQPKFRSRFFDEVRLDILAPLLPGHDPQWASLHYWHHPEYTLSYDTPARHEGVADPADLAKWQPNELGLIDLRPSTDPDEGAFAAYREDGRIRTFIWCSYRRCEHSFVPETPLWQSDVYIQTGYPIEMLPKWEQIETAALDQFLALRTGD